MVYIRGTLYVLGGVRGTCHIPFESKNVSVYKDGRAERKILIPYAIWTRVLMAKICLPENCGSRVRMLSG